MIVVMAVIKCDRDRRGTNMSRRKVGDGIQPGEDIEQDGEATAMQQSEFDGSPT